MFEEITLSSSDSENDRSCLQLSNQDKIEKINKKDSHDEIMILDLKEYAETVKLECTKFDIDSKIFLNVGHSKKDPDIYFNTDIVSILKHHQISGIRFMFQNCIKSIHDFNLKNGQGCLIAHCMGLGKTLQAITFSDIFLHHTPGKSVLCLAPTSTIPNWLKEFDNWLLSPNRQTTFIADNNNATKEKIKVSYLIDSEHKTANSKLQILGTWKRKGGVLIMGYELFRSLVTRKNSQISSSHNAKRFKDSYDKDEIDHGEPQPKSEFWNYLIDPGPDLIICDEGHRIKSQYASLSKVLKKIKTLRRVVLTGYPLQNNLIEYWSMIDFVRPGFLGSLSDFKASFERPITQGQKPKATALEARVGRIKSHVLHTLLEGVVQRRDATLLAQSLPPKREYILSVKLSSAQRIMYRRLKTRARQLKDSSGLDLNDLLGPGSHIKRNCAGHLAFFAAALKILNHPHISEMYPAMAKECKSIKEVAGFGQGQSGKVELFLRILEETVARGEKLLLFSQSVLTLDYLEKVLARTELNIKSAPVLSSNETSGQTNGHCVKKLKMVKNVNYFRLDGSTPYSDRESSIRLFNAKKKSPKNRVVEESAPKPPQDPNSLDTNDIDFLDVHSMKADENGGIDPFTPLSLGGKRKKHRRISSDSDASTDNVISSDETLCLSPLRPDPPSPGEKPCTSLEESGMELLDDHRMKGYHLFLLSTRAGSLGINLTAASRVIIFDASWNPCHDVQALSRVYRMGQTRPCTVYRFIGHKTLESRVFKKQLHKQSLSNVVVDKTETSSHKHHRLKGFKESSGSNDEDNMPGTQGPFDEQINSVVTTQLKVTGDVGAPYNNQPQPFGSYPASTGNIKLNKPTELITLLSSSSENEEIVLDLLTEMDSDSDCVKVIDHPSIPARPTSFRNFNQPVGVIATKNISVNKPSISDKTKQSPHPQNNDFPLQFEDDILTAICSQPGDVGKTWLALAPWLKPDDMLQNSVVKQSIIAHNSNDKCQYVPAQKVALTQQELYIARRLLDSYKCNNKKNLTSIRPIPIINYNNSQFNRPWSHNNLIP